MATQHCDNEKYSNAPGGLDITWWKDNYFAMTVTFPYDITGYTYTAGVTDKLGNALANMVISGIAVTPSGIINCSLDSSVINNLPTSSYWFMDETDSSNRVSTKLAGLFNVKVKGDLCQ